MNVGFIGLGNIGKPIARRLLQPGLRQRALPVRLDRALQFAADADAGKAKDVGDGHETSGGCGRGAHTGTLN